MEHVHSDAFNYGYDSFHWGWSIDDNPFKEGTALHYMWKSGWRYADKEDLDSYRYDYR